MRVEAAVAFLENEGFSDITPESNDPKSTNVIRILRKGLKAIVVDASIWGTMDDEDDFEVRLTFHPKTSEVAQKDTDYIKSLQKRIVDTVLNTEEGD